jgi:catechol-2,3-dioxygenase
MSELYNDLVQTTTFFYYKDLNKVNNFYQNILGLKVITDLGWVKIYKLTDNSNLGVVDEEKGYHESDKIKPVMITVNIRNIEKWYNYLMKKDIEIVSEIKKHNQLENRLFLIKDPEGYVIEFMES